MTATFVGVVVALTTALAGSAVAPEQELRLVEGSTTTARLSVPYPGHSTDFDVTATPASDRSADLALVIASGGGQVAESMVLTLTDGQGALLAEGTPLELEGTPIALGTLESAPVTVHGAASLPSTAGDDLQGVGLVLTFELVAAEQTPVTQSTGDTSLAVTGSQVLTASAVTVLMILGGFLLLAARRTTRTEEES